MSFKETKAVTYFRLLSYAKPYALRLTIGILAGFIVGGSLFGSILMIPSLMHGIEFTKKVDDREIEKKAAKIVDSMDRAGASKEARLAAARDFLKKPAGAEESKIRKDILKVNDKLHAFGIKNISLDYRRGNLEVEKDKRIILTLPAEKPDGKMTWQIFAILCSGFILLWTVKNIATYINHYLTRWVGVRVVTDLRGEAFKRLMDQSLRFYGNIDVGQLISRITNDTAAIETSVSNVIADLTRCPIEILACAGAIVYASLSQDNWSLPLILFIGMPLCILPVAIIGRKIRKIYRKSFSRIADVVTRMHESFTGIMIVKAYHAEKREILRFEQANFKYFRTVEHAIRAQLLMAPLMEVVAVASTLVFLIYSYSQDISLGQLAQLLAPCFLAYQPIKNLAKISTDIQRSMAAADRYFQLIDCDTDLKEAEDAVPMKKFEQEIAFNDVSFSYSEKRIVDHVSFRIPKGSIVAAVGETGSGKTTIANLLARFYDCDSGSVTIDGTDVKKIKVADLRNMIGVVTQEAILFNDTIADNIAYGLPGATQEQIENAAKQANAHSFIVDGRHPQGYETEAGEKGFRLSGGEKQRVSIARAILKNPPILILDEATSALDTVTEKLVQDALNNVMENRTVFAIAHRLSTIMNADLILVLDHGKIVERGTHQELLALGGRYKKLYDTQFAQNSKA